MNRNFYNIPECSWSRALGDIPPKCASSSPKRGVVLGGFGSGSFMYNITGSFGPFQSFDNVIHKEITLKGASFHLYEKTVNSKPVVKTLSTDYSYHNWNWLQPGSGTYYALQPKGWITYNCFANDISQKFFSPVIPHNYKESSYPAGIWEFRIYNPMKHETELSIMLTLPAVFIGAYETRRDFNNRFKKNKNTAAVILKSNSYKGEWCIAVPLKNKVSYTTSWNVLSTGKDVWNAFSHSGELTNKPLDKSNSAAAIAVKIKLKPGQVKYIPFIISWDFPVVKFGQGTEWWKKYTDYFGQKGNNSFTIADTALKKYRLWEKAIDKWQEPVINNSKYPDWLKCAAFNELYYSQFGGIFYSSKIKSNSKYKKYFSKFKHIFSEQECVAYSFCNTLDVRHYSSLCYTKFWPRIERDILLLFSDNIKKDKSHRCPHDSGSPYIDPFIKFHAYDFNILEWKDLSPKFILQCWRYYYLYKDRDFLNKVWKTCLSTYGFMKSTDKNGDYIPDNNKSDNTYDAWGLYGTSLLCGGLWIAALEALKKMASLQKDPVLQEIKLWLKTARKNLDNQLWYEKGQYYKIDTDSKYPTAIMSDGLNGQRYCESYGLPDILPKKRIRSHLLKVYNKCVKPLKDYNKDGIGDVGAINGKKENGSLLKNEQSDEVWTGSTYLLSASMYHAGLKKEALNTGFGIYYTTYVNYKTAYWFNVPEAWDKNGLNPRPCNPEQYQRVRAVWELLLEIDDPYTFN